MILVLGDTNGYPKQQLEIEGLNGYFHGKHRLPGHLSIFNLIIVTNQFTLDKRQKKRLLGHINSGGNLILINTSVEIELLVGLVRDKTEVLGEIPSTQICNIIIYSAEKGLYPIIFQKKQNAIPMSFLRKTLGRMLSPSCI
jgi:hypothetical protein